MFNRRRASRKHEASPVAVFESLENRTLLSGTVTVEMVGKNLLITGDGADNTISILADAVTGSNQTTIQGAAVPSTVKGDIIVKMLGGNDSMFVDVPTILGNLKIDGGDGNNHIEIEQTTVNKSMFVTNADGFDTTVTDGTVTILGSLTISDGDGGSSNSLLHLHVGGAMTLTNGNGLGISNGLTLGGTVGKALKVTNGDGATGISLDNAHIAGAVTITSGAGDDNITAGGPSTIGGAMTVNAGAGDLGFSISSSVVNGNVTATTTESINSTLGNSSFGGLVKMSAGGSGFAMLQFSTVAKDFNYTGGSGDDVLVLMDSAIHGNVTVNAGAGANTFNLGGNLHIGGNLNYTGLDGIDSLNMIGTVGKNATLNLGAGDDIVTFSGQTIQGSLTVLGGDGTDIVNMNYFAVGKTTTLDLGGGNDTFNLDDSHLSGLVKITTGAGSDIVDIERHSNEDGLITTLGAGLTILSGSDTISLGTANNAGNLLVVGGALTVNSFGLPQMFLEANVLVLGKRTVV